MSKLSLLKNLTVLVVDDDLEFLDTFKIILSTYFNEVITCTNGLEAYNVFQKNIVDLIVTDYVMPDINGYDLCYKIRKTDRKLPIILMSNYSEKDKLLNVIPLKITYYLLKPISFQKLVKALDFIIEELEENDVLCKIKNFSNFSYDFSTKKLINSNDKYEIFITKSEIIFIELLVQNINKIISHKMINDAFQEIKSEQAIKNLIYRLRLKLGENLIENIHGMGYTLKLAELDGK